tara:strand:- start:131 stop:337 length:207 start_codon:yes stop_codon:yes gene_type:complete
MLTGGTWNVLSKVMCLSDRIYNKPEHRKTLEGILYKMRTGIHGEVYLLILAVGVLSTDGLIYGSKKGF